MYLILRVDPRHVFLARLQLRQCSAQPLTVRMLADPDGHGQASLLVELPQGRADAVMHHVMSCLPAAEFGRLGTHAAGSDTP